MRLGRCPTMQQQQQQQQGGGGRQRADGSFWFVVAFCFALATFMQISFDCLPTASPSLALSWING